MGNQDSFPLELTEALKRGYDAIQEQLEVGRITLVDLCVNIDEDSIPAIRKLAILLRLYSEQMNEIYLVDTPNTKKHKPRHSQDYGEPR